MRIGRRRYVDGGVCSVSNLDLVAGRGLDLVICLNPLTGARGGGLATDPLGWVPALTRGPARRRLDHERRKVRSFGTEVVILEPTVSDHEAMGLNWMSAERRQRVIETARATVAEQLRRPELRGALAGLPPGKDHKLRRPEGPPSSWPELGPAAAVRRAA